MIRHHPNGGGAEVDEGRVGDGGMGGWGPRTSESLLTGGYSRDTLSS